MDEKHVAETRGGIRRSKWAFLVYGLLLGALVILGIRFFTYKPTDTHYHANFAVYIDGKQVSFKEPRYYEEVRLCSLEGSTPAARVHMHGGIPGDIHVHDQAVTWGAFFQELGWDIGPNYIYDGAILHVADGTNGLSIMLNGQNLTGLTNIADQTIHDKDRLLVSFGSEDQAALTKEYATVRNNAAQYDSEKDPSSCKGPEDNTLSSRFHHLF